MGNLKERIFCAFCKLEREVYTRKHITSTNVALCILTGLSIGYLIWGGLDGRMVLLTVVSMIFAEAFVHTRWRLSITCPHCAFDPILYKTDRIRVVQMVKERLEAARANDAMLLKKNNPLRNIPVIKKNGNEMTIELPEKSMQIQQDLDL
jgi:glutaredoxin